MDIDAPQTIEKMDFSAESAEFHDSGVNVKESFLESSVVINSETEQSGLILAAHTLESDPTVKSVMDTDDSVSAHELNFPEVKEQMLKEVEEMKGDVLIDDGVNDDDIEKLLNPKPMEDHTVPIEDEESQTNDDQSLTIQPADEEEPLDEDQADLSSANPDQIEKEDIKAALDEIKTMDVLVCGNCHLTFHFVEEFTNHKSTCSKHSPFVGGMIEQKPTVWAFLLFKNALVKQNPQKYSGGLTESSWKLYQKWCKLPENTRNAWITAGESVMKYVSMGNLKKDNSKVLPSKGSDRSMEDDDPKRPVVMKKICQRDQSGEITKIRPGGFISQSDSRSSLGEDREPSKTQHLDDEEHLNIPPLTSSKSFKKASETIREEEFVVERIVSRRFNPRRKQYEYLLKWEGYPPEQNTWEPAENLETCQHLLKAFEESLNKQALKMKNMQGRKSDYSMPSSSGNSMSKFGRPVRSSKQKALSQVKQWCGSIKPDEAEIDSLMKRKLSPTDSDEDEDNFVGKRIRMGSDSEESIGGRGSMKGIGGVMKKNTNAPTPSRGVGRPRKYPLSNGVSNSQAVESSDEGEGKSTLEILSQANVTKTLNLSPANQQVLVANAKGVVKVDPSQVPNLSSGVYIMSNKSGIIKLDSVSPSKALSMKQGIVKDISPAVKTSGAATPQPQTTKSVVVLNKNQTPTHHEMPPKSGIVRKTSVTPQVTQRVVTSSPSVFPGSRTPAKQQPRTTGSIKINNPNPNTRFLHSGANRQNFSITPSNKPKTVIRTGEPQKRIMGIESRTVSATNRIERGILSGGMRGGRGGAVRSGITKAQTNTQNLPPIAPASPPRPLSLCPETGKVLLKAEGEKTPDPLPSPTMMSMSTTQHTAADIQSAPLVIKEEFIEKPQGISEPVEPEQMLTQAVQQQNQLKPIRPKKEPDNSPPKAKESLVKRTLGKPGSIGSMTVSPKKILPEIEDPDSDVVTISGEDGMIYKVSKSELNNSLLMAGEDGQQCVYLTTGENGDENATVITLDPSSYTEQVNQIGQVNVLNEVGEEEQQFYVKEGEEGELMDIQVQEGADDGQSQLVAQLVEAGEPAPGGGPRRVVLLLPDGNLMMTEVDEEQYAALELDKFQGQTAEME